MTDVIEGEVYNQDESALRPGTLLCGGKYRIVKKLGQGGFGITYLGEQIALNRRVAIKEYYQKDLCERSSSSTNITLGTTENRKMWDMFLKKFIKEAQAIAQFESTNIVKIYDIFSENGTAYYVMEYIDGGSLDEMISRKGRLTKAEAYDIITQLANALGYVHSQNRLHLDVKPGNVLMRGGKEVVLIDFGISKYYNETGSETSKTPPGVSAGYSPVEQYHQGGVSKFSPSTDIYALGATLYKMLTGIRPPESTELAYQGFDILDIPSYIDRDTELVITKTMQQIGSNRPQSVSEFLVLLGGGKKGTDNRTKVVSPEVTEITGSILAQCSPAGAEILIDGRSVGTTPRKIGGISAGRHQVEVRASGYESRSWTVDVSSGVTSDVKGSLTAKAAPPTPPPGSRRSTLLAILVGALVAVVIGVWGYLAIQ